MSEFRSICIAIDLATKQRDELAQAQARASRNRGLASDQMAQLKGYAGETDTRWMAASSVARSPEIIRHHYQFMERLQQAITLQEQVMADMAQQLDVAHQKLLQAEFRLAGLNKILEVRKAALLKKQKRRDQYQTDEFAALQHARGKLLTMHGDTT